MGNTDSNKNRNPNLPSFDIIKKGRIEASVFRMDTGYLVINQDTMTRHSLTDEGQIEDMLKTIGEDTSLKLVDMLKELNPSDYVDLIIIVEAKQEEYIPEPIEEDQTSLDLSQIADMFNDIMSGYADPTGIRPVRLTAPMLHKYLNSQRFVKITRRTRIADEQGRGSSQHSNRPIFNPGKGGNREVKNKEKDDKGDGQGGAKPNKIE